MLDPVRRRYGEPAALTSEGEITEQELALVLAEPGRRHDITLFVLNGPRLALIRKPHFGPGVWRTPGGGVKPGEDVSAAAVREALEETGAEIELERYLVAAAARFRHDSTQVDWRTHVVSARTSADALDPLDRREIAVARWGSAEELGGPIRTALLGTGRALWRYRVALHDAALSALRTG